MTLEASVLQDDAVRATPQGYEVDVHLAWYRSLPLSCVEELSVTVGDRTPDRGELRILHDGRELGLDALAERVDEEWFVQDPLTVRVADPAPVAAGRDVDVSVHVATRIPYIIIGPEKALVQHARVSRRVTVR